MDQSTRRPNIAFVKQLVAEHPEDKTALTGTDDCAFFDPAGNLVESHFKSLTDLINRYEVEQFHACSSMPRCHTDGGVRAAYVDKLDNFSSDWAHLNIRGQAAEAELIWPVVAAILNL